MASSNFSAMPRFTSSIRAKRRPASEVLSAPTSTVLNLESIKRKRTRKKEKGRSIAELIKLVSSGCSSHDKQKIEEHFHLLQQSSREIVGHDVDQSAVDSAAVFLFDLFVGNATWSVENQKEIRNKLGPFPASAAEEAFKSVVNITAIAPHCKDLERSDPEQGPPNSQEEFGKRIKFSFPNWMSSAGKDSIGTVSGEEAREACDDSLSDSDEEDGRSGSHSELLADILSQPQARSTALTRGDVAEPVEKSVKVPVASSENRYSAEWLQARCRGCGSGTDWKDLFSAIFDSLSTGDEGIENDLVELLGLEELELVQELLAHRETIVASVLEDSSSLLQSVPGAKGKSAASVGTARPTSHSRPAVGSQVTIQSEQEKLLKKMYRKEERKVAKQVRDLKSVGVTDRAAQLQLLGYDPAELKKEREQSLEEASRRPLLTGRSVHRPVDPSAIYPHVYDSLAQAKLTSAFVADSKLVIPADSERKNNSIMEEITIPHTGSAPPAVGEDRVQIKELDEVAQLAFRGTKALNRIQSVVFDAAYYTNENLLISAPTGAGKTNIAMLTVLREIKNNIEGGVIKSDKFKVIYVAPMKALAAEMVRNFGARLEPLGVRVRELTGDMQLTKAEIQRTQMIVTTPEKWDVVTRKATGDVQLAQIVRLLIIDEVHLLHEDRGAVIESLVARTLRQVESTQNMIRIVGLSATLPNYLDVARFLRVNPRQGLFFFDGRFRPVPLSQSFVGVKAPNKMKALRDMDEVCYDKVLENVRKGHQVMVFVHARNATVKTATALRDMAASNGELPLFAAEQTTQFGLAEKQVSKSRNKPLRDLFGDGFSIHHAGMLRPDRNLVERMFSEGFIKVLVCTATLAWGVNLPAHAVIIKGTQIYDSKKGSFVDLGILDVLQIFGRAGRPQFDKFGEGTIITTHDKLAHYLSLMTRQHPIESQLLAGLCDNLNAEISLGTVTSIDEAVQWLSYTYLYIRMRSNPLVYGIRHDYQEDDPHLEKHREKVVVEAARRLDRARMIRFVDTTGALHATDMGRTASHFYIKHTSIEMFNENLKPIMNEAKILATVSKSDEFDQLKVREDEVSELSQLCQNCFLSPEGGVENSHGKVNILLQTFISRDNVDSFSLTSDLSYVAQNTGRILRGLFEIALKKGAPLLSSHMLTLCKCVDHRLWMFEHPLKQFGGDRVTADILDKLEQKKASIPRLRDMSQDEIGHLVNHVRMGREVQKLVHAFPMLNLAASIQPITRTVIKVRLDITPDFTWNDRIHGTTSEPFWVWVEDAENNHMYHSEYFLLQKKQVLNDEVQELTFTIPIFEPLPPQYIVRVISDRWLQAESVVAISFKHLILPEIHPPHTKLLDLHPLPVTALSNVAYEQLYSFSHFNPVQTQAFHTLYHSDTNVLLGAPTGSGKTVAAELAIFRVFNCYPGGKAVYIAPLKALVRERIVDWKVRLEEKLNRRVVELTGDTSPDIRAIEKADVIVTTPEKWDGISRSWQNRKYVQAMRLLVIDEIHLLGDDRGPVLEVIVSRTNFIASHTKQEVRVVGLSTALANASDLAEWLNIKQAGLFNFHPAVRPVQLEVHIDSFPGKHYCPRMATMNRPAYSAIQVYSPHKPALIFVSSRRQTRLTAFDLVAFLGVENDPKQWLHMDETEMDRLVQSVSDPNLRHTLSFGIGLHHAGLQERDRKTVEELFVNQKIQVLIATSTLAWGVNFPAHLVIVKGTEYFDGKTQRYVDYPITDVLQMMGRAGRPQYDDKGVAVILVHDIKKHFYKKFLYEPFPVESSLLEVFPDHLNAEIVAGTVTSKQDAMDYVTWTYFFRRLLKNPSYYHLEDAASINHYLSELVAKALAELQDSYCVEIEEDERTVHPLTLGCISSFYYLHHKTVRLFRERLTPQASFEDLLQLLCDSCEYDELPVRHNEDGLNKMLSQRLPLDVSPPDSYDSPHTKAHLLLQAHFERAELPIADYATDTKSVLDQALRILQSLIDICADEGWLSSTLRVMHLVQMCTQGRWISDPSLLTLPHLRYAHMPSLGVLNNLQSTHTEGGMSSLAELLSLYDKDRTTFATKMAEITGSKPHADNICEVLSKLPIVYMRWKVVHKSCTMTPVTAGAGLSPQERLWVDIKGTEDDDDEVVVQVELMRRCVGKKVESRVYAPKFPKPKEEGWWLVLGSVDSGELVALKRLPFFKSKTRTSLAFSVPDDSCRHIYSLYLLSDSYLGLDQQCELCLNFIIN